MKYRLTGETKEWGGHTLHKIEYTEEWLKEQELDELEGGWAFFDEGDDET